MDRREALKTVGAMGAVALLPTITLAEPKKELCGWMVRYRSGDGPWFYNFTAENLKEMGTELSAKEFAEMWGEDMKQRWKKCTYEIFPVYR